MSADYTEMFHGAYAVTPSDSDDIVAGVPVVGGLWVGGLGDVTVIPEYGGTVTFSAVAAGTFLPIRCKRVKVATTATLIVALV